MNENGKELRENIRQRLVDLRKDRVQGIGKKVRQQKVSAWEKEGVPQALVTLRELAVAYEVSADHILLLTDDPRPPVEQKPLPEGATEIVKYLSGMSERGREQLLKIARVLWEEDLEWQQRLIVAGFMERSLDEATLTAVREQAATMYAKTGDFDATFDHLRKTFGYLGGGNLSE
jgi:hypothetical protein